MIAVITEEKTIAVVAAAIAVIVRETAGKAECMVPLHFCGAVLLHSCAICGKII